MPDIDIDFPDRNLILDQIKHIPASILDQNKKHNTGVYCQQIPINPLTGWASIDYKQAEDRGYFKLDFLNVSLYQGIKDEAHLVKLLEQEPLWDLLLEADFVDNLFHVNGHSEVLKKQQPKTIEELAMVLAMIRPAKRHLIGQDWDTIRKEVWQVPKDDQYFFKKSHAVAYATAIVIQMNLICENISYDYS